MASISAVDAVGDDAVRPFQVDALDIRGRAIQMGPALDAILSRHAYPPAVAKVVGEAIVLAVLLGSSLKFDGQFILQTETDGPLRRVIVDYRTAGHIRAYASFDPDAVAAAGDIAGGALLGKGTLAMTVDQGAAMSRYQGVVALDGSSLEEAAHVYFRQSEQIPTKLRLAVAELMVREGSAVTRHWRAGGLLAQFLPQSFERRRMPDLPGGDAPEGAGAAGGVEDDAWIEAQSLIATVEDRELVDSDVPVDRLLYRLFHERGVRVFDAKPVEDRCSCSRERVSGMLRSFSAEDLERSIENGRIAVKCEFCGTNYAFDPAEFRQ
jgi:molecular chaperone Hsp33